MIRRHRLAVLLVFIFSLCLSGIALARDWEQFPPWVEIHRARRVAVVGDVHGALPQLRDTLEALHVAKAVDREGARFAWTGGTSVLIFLGDLNDRGTHTKEVYDIVIDLQRQADRAGGRVIALLGNHEVLMLNGTVEHWANTLQSHKKQHYQNTIDSFTRAGLDYHQAISPKGVYGRWIRQRPLFAMVNGLFFAHAGLPRPPTTRSELAADYRDVVEADNWSEESLFMNHSNVLWHRDWWKDPELIDDALKVLGARGVVFGHTIGALGKKGTVACLAGKVFSVDVGMTPAYGNSNGGGMLITLADSGRMIFRAVYPDRPEQLLGSMAFEQPLEESSRAIGR